MMNPVVKSLWLAALRSGEYTQTCGVLKDGKGHCCLGVLTELYLKDHPDAYWKTIDTEIMKGFELIIPGESRGIGILSESVCEWAGLEGADRHNPLIQKFDDDNGETLSGFNDGGTSFTAIADLIEEYL